MKKTDLTEPVMQKIVNFEKKRTRHWLLIFFGIIFILLLTVLATTSITIKQMIDFQTFDMLTLFNENREIISDFWQETLATVWAEMPEQVVATAFLAVLLIIFIVVVTRSRRKIIKKRIAELEKYRKNK